MAIDLLVSATNEQVIEPNQTVTAVLLPDPAYTILSPSNAVITILDGNTILGTAQVNSSGQWTFKCPALAMGIHHLRIADTNLSGYTGLESNELTIDI